MLEEKPVLNTLACVIPGCSPHRHRKPDLNQVMGPLRAGPTCLVLTCFQAQSVTMGLVSNSPSLDHRPSSQHCTLRPAASGPRGVQHVPTSMTLTLASGSPQWEVDAGTLRPAAGKDVGSQAGLPLLQDQSPALPTPPLTRVSSPPRKICKW